MEENFECVRSDFFLFLLARDPLAVAGLPRIPDVEENCGRIIEVGSQLLWLRTRITNHPLSRKPKMPHSHEEQAKAASAGSTDVGAA